MSTIMTRLSGAVRGMFSKKKKDQDEVLVGMTDQIIAGGGLATPEGMMALQAVLLADSQRQRAHERKLQNDESRWKMIRRGTLLFVMLSGAISGSILYLYRNGFKMPNNKPVSVVSITGEIGLSPGGSAENIIPSLRRAFENSDSKGVILRINSGGGLPVDAERVNRELEALKKAYPEKEVTAVIETVGASAAYMMAVHADKICAGKYSLVGSIGAIVSAWNVNGLAQKLQISKDSYGSGKFKALLDPFKEMNQEEKDKIFSLVYELGGTFANEVMDKRKDKLKLTRDELATGEIWTGTLAVKNGLVDEICTIETVAAKYDAQPRDYGPYTSQNGWTNDVARAIGRGFANGVMSAMDSQAVQPK